VRATYGSEPVVQYFETPLVADNALGETIGERGDEKGRRGHWSSARQ
jgi:hypothetical protein